MVGGSPAPCSSTMVRVCSDRTLPNATSVVHTFEYQPFSAPPSRMRKLEATETLRGQHSRGMNTGWKYHDGQVTMSRRRALSAKQACLWRMSYTPNQWELPKVAVGRPLVYKAGMSSDHIHRRELPVAHPSLWIGAPDSALQDHPESSRGNILKWEKLRLRLKI